MNISDELRARGFMTEAEAARFLGIAANTLKFWRAQKKGPRYFKPAKQPIYRRDDLEAFVLNSAVRTADVAA
jgi:hypothetical protein